MTKHSERIKVTRAPIGPQTNLNNNEKKVKVYWIPLLERTLSNEAANSLLNVAMTCGALNYVRLQNPYMRTDLARNSIVHTFMEMSENEDDILVMLDTDHTFPYDTVARLASYPHEIGVVGALAFRRGTPFDPLMFIRCPDNKLHPISQWEKDSLMPCEMVGHGAIAIKRWVLTELKKASQPEPFYRYDYRPDNTAPSEDMYFGLICEQAGIKHYCDTGLIIPHHWNQSIDELNWRKWLKDNPGNEMNANNLEADQIPPLPPGENVKIHKLSVIIPTRNRAEQLTNCLDSLFSTAPDRSIVETVVVVNEDDFASLEAVKHLPIKLVKSPGDSTAVQKWNLGAAQASGDWLMEGADDLIFKPGWFEEVCNTPNRGFIGIRDPRFSMSTFAPHYLASRDWLIKYNGGVLSIPHYKSWSPDLEIARRAQRAGHYAVTATECVEHHHKMWGMALNDDTYKIADPLHKPDQDLEVKRKAAGYPDDFEPIIKPIKPSLKEVLLAKGDIILPAIGTRIEA